MFITLGHGPRESRSIGSVSIRPLDDTVVDADGDRASPSDPSSLPRSAPGADRPGAGGPRQKWS
jgi:hypothetical protein